MSKVVFVCEKVEKPVFQAMKVETEEDFNKIPEFLNNYYKITDSYYGRKNTDKNVLGYIENIISAPIAIPKDCFVINKNGIAVVASFAEFYNKYEEYYI